MARAKLKKVAVVMGSQSDLPVMKEAVAVLKELKVAVDTMVVSAHRTPEWMYDFATSAEASYDVIIAGAGGAAHLPGMIASLTQLPVIGVPIKLKALEGMDSLLSIVQMPRGVPVMTMAINGAENAGLSAARIRALSDEKLRERLKKRKEKRARDVLRSKKIKV